MKNEDFMKLVLDKLTNLEQGQANLETQVTRISQSQAKLEQGQANLEQSQAKLEQSQAKLEQSQANLETQVTRISQNVSKIEVEHRQFLEALHDGQNLITAKLEPIPAAIESLQNDVSLIKSVVSAHDDDIKVLKVAK